MANLQGLVGRKYFLSGSQLWQWLTLRSAIMTSFQPAFPTIDMTRSRRRGTSLSSLTSAIISTTEDILGTDIPRGFLAATVQETSSAPTLSEIRRGSLGERHARRTGTHGQDSNMFSLGWDSSELRGHDRAYAFESKAFPALREVPSKTGNSLSTQGCAEPLREERISPDFRRPSQDHDGLSGHSGMTHSIDYTRSPELPWTTSTAIALKAFWKWFWTPSGFLITIYGLNIVAWGGMLFLLLCNASPAMCWTSDGNGGEIHDCNNTNSPRRKWIEVDSQILTALFCVTGLGLIPWRFRDLYYILSFRFTDERKHGRTKKLFGLRKLASHFRSWYRLPESDTLEPKLDNPEINQALEEDLRVPLPVNKRPDDPLTGTRAAPTAVWKMDVFIWCQVWNTIFQICLCGVMWGLDRYNRPSWATGLFVALACVVVGVGGVVSYIEGRRVTRIEGVMPSKAVREALRRDEHASDLELGLHQTRSCHGSVHVGPPKTLG